MYKHINPGRPGGVIVMKAGIPYSMVKPQPSKSAVCKDVLDSVHRNHSAGILHRDIRWPNVVQFGLRFHRVEYGLSSNIDDSVCAFIPSGDQRNALGPRAKRLVESSQMVSRTKADDYEMLPNMLVS